MNTLEAINTAIAAHGKWKDRLKQAIQDGTSAFQPTVVKTDNQCDFGKWLYHDVTTEQQATAYFEKVKRLHAEFHVEAARVLELALNGDKLNAEIGLGFGGQYAKISAALTSVLEQWHASVKE